MLVSDFVRILQLSIGPAILVSGIGLLLLSMTNRFGRVIDRARVLVPRMTADHGDGAKRIAAQLHILARRARALRAAITFAVISLLLTVLLVIGLFAASACHCETHSMAVTLTSCFAASMVGLIVALVLFLYELNLSLNALWLEMPATFRRHRLFWKHPS